MGYFILLRLCQAAFKTRLQYVWRFISRRGIYINTEKLPVNSCSGEYARRVYGIIVIGARLHHGAY